MANFSKNWLYLHPEPPRPGKKLTNYCYSIDKTKKLNNHRLGYIEDWIEYSHDFLSCTLPKIHHYNDCFYRELFNRFRLNLKKAECLIIIGYGGRDPRINKYIFF